MCDFISWLEFPNGEILYLTAEDVFHTKRGKELRDYCGSERDYVGHGAIEFYYEVRGMGGVHKECTDFSSPANFPDEIVEDLKAGRFAGLAVAPALLTSRAWAEYKKVSGPARAAYKRVSDMARAEYEKVSDMAWAEYKKVCDKAFWSLFAKKLNRVEAWR